MEPFSPSIEQLPLLTIYIYYNITFSHIVTPFPEFRPILVPNFFLALYLPSVSSMTTLPLLYFFKSY